MTTTGGTRIGYLTLLASALALNACASSPALPDPLAAGWNGAAVCEVLSDDHRQRVLRCTFAPGVGHEKHFHAAHFGYVLSGGLMQVTDANGTREVELASASSFSSDGVEWHEVLNIGETTTRFLIVESK